MCNHSAHREMITEDTGAAYRFIEEKIPYCGAARETEVS